MKYASRFEEYFAKALQEAGVKYQYEPESLQIWVPQSTAFICDECDGSTIAKESWYLPDFVVRNIILETKGKWDAPNRKKMLCVKEQWPELRVIMMFMADNYLTKNKKRNYSSWCESKDLEYVVTGNIVRSKDKFKELVLYLKENIK